MLKEVFVITFLILLSSTVESTKQIKKVLSLVKEIKNQMVTFDEMEEIKNQMVTFDEMIEIKNQIVDEIVNAINPTFATRCTQGIFIAGGNDYGDGLWGSQSSPGFYNPLTNEYCNIPQMTTIRYGSTTTGFMVCGGFDSSYNILNNCEVFDPSTGTWTVLPPWVGPSRHQHVAWMSSIGLFLIGGAGSLDSSMLLKNDGSITEGAIDSGRRGACAVADPKTDTVIIIGGLNSAGVTDEVIRYNVYGTETPLPPLNYPRYYFGCSGYYNNVGNLVLVVTGTGENGTEHLEVGVDSSWTYYDYNNPWSISCADANNDVYCLQGYEGYDIQEYDPSTGGFIYKTSTEDFRSAYGNFASSVCIDSGVEDSCNYSKSGKKSLPQDHSNPFPKPSEDEKNLPSDNSIN